MDAEKLSKYTFIAVLLVILYFSIVIIKPFFTYFILAIILSYMCRRPYYWLLKRTKSKIFSASLMIFAVLLIVIVPSVFIITSLVSQGGTAITAVRSFASNEIVNSKVAEWLGPGVNLQPYLDSLFLRLRNFIVSEGPQLISGAGNILLGIFVMFFTLYYFLKGGDALVEDVKDLIPLKKKYKSRLFQEIGLVVHAVLYGTLLTALVQGSLGGLGFYIAGLPNPIFWGFIMVILSFLPVVGAPLVWVPGCLYLLSTNKIGAAIFLFIYCLVLVSNIDNVIKPHLISHKVKLHPAVVLVGVIGGLKVFGFIGFIIGPLVLAVLLVLLRSYVSDYQMNV